jgi:hypothetical protein
MAGFPNTSMVSEVSICNQALLWLGQNIITSFDDESTTAQWCRNNYPFLRDAVLEARTWTFAISRFASTTANTPAWGPGFSHTLPGNWLMVTRVFRDATHTDPNKWRVSEGWRLEAGKVIADQGTVYMQGLTRISDTSSFSSLFVQALAARIAADAAIPLTENRQLQVDMWGLYNDKLTEAAARDGQQGTSDVVTQRGLTSARYSSLGIGSN